ncbi:hypothetical protein [Phocaeicola coprocola]|jgi:arsenate reductase-like glutaredoxin family protein|uniref:hypothetical protein n=1 Tax=Phocaeicola coprocola TaxID=310298 RepID=UPI0026DC030A|nr:hypothetical protein [Phocaeicola coprocola]
MKKEKYLSEDELVEKYQNGEIGWTEYVRKHSKEWNEEYDEYLRKNSLTESEETAYDFLRMKDREIMEMENE